MKRPLQRSHHQLPRNYRSARSGSTPPDPQQRPEEGFAIFDNLQKPALDRKDTGHAKAVARAAQAKLAECPLTGVSDATVNLTVVPIRP